MNADTAIRIIEPPPSRGQLLYDGIRSLRKPKPVSYTHLTLPTKA